MLVYQRVNLLYKLILWAYDIDIYTLAILQFFVSFFGGNGEKTVTPLQG